MRTKGKVEGLISTSDVVKPFLRAILSSEIACRMILYGSIWLFSSDAKECEVKLALRKTLFKYRLH